MSRIINTTKKSGLSVAKVDRNKLDTLYNQLIELIKENPELGVEYEYLFAKPKDLNFENAIDWYTDLGGEIRSFSTMAPDQTVAVLEQYQRMVEKLNNYQMQLRQAGEKSSADLIKNALIIPNNSYLMLVGDHLVTTCWGFSNAQDNIATNSAVVGLVEDKKEEAPTRIAQRKPMAVPKETEPKPEPTEIIKPKKRSLWPFFLLFFLCLAACALFFFFKKYQQTAPHPLAHLKGTYTAKGVLQNKQGVPIDLQFTMDEQGTGTSRIIRSQQTCQGTINADNAENNTVILHFNTLTCPDNNDNFSPFVLICDKNQKCTAQTKGQTDWSIELVKEPMP